MEQKVTKLTKGNQKRKTDHRSFCKMKGIR